MGYLFEVAAIGGWAVWGILTLTVGYLLAVSVCIRSGNERLFGALWAITFAVFALGVHGGASSALSALKSQGVLPPPDEIDRVLAQASSVLRTMLTPLSMGALLATAMALVNGVLSATVLRRRGSDSKVGD